MKKVIQVAVKEPQYVVSTDVAFAQVDAWFGHTVRDLKLDVIYPEHTEKRPCIVWICGGAWLQMSVSAHLAYLCDLAREGFVVASVQYLSLIHICGRQRGTYSSVSRWNGELD